MADRRGRGRGHFTWRGPLLPRVRPVHSPAGRGGAGIDHMAELLHGLRGREIIVQVESVRIAGRLITVDPVVMVGAGGRAAMIRMEAIRAVEF